MKLREILKGAKPFDPDAFEPLEGAEELLPDRPLSDVYSEVARRAAGLEAQLKQMTAMWTARGEDIEYLASELREAKYEIAHLRKSIANSDRDHWYAEAQRLREALEWIRHQAGVASCDDAIGTMGEVYEEATEALGHGCDRCGLPVALRYVPEYGANFCERCAADPQATS